MNSGTYLRPFAHRGIGPYVRARLPKYGVDLDVLTPYCGRMVWTRRNPRAITPPWGEDLQLVGHCRFFASPEAMASSLWADVAFSLALRRGPTACGPTLPFSPTLKHPIWDPILDPICFSCGPNFKTNFGPNLFQFWTQFQNQFWTSFQNQFWTQFVQLWTQFWTQFVLCVNQWHTQINTRVKW